MSSRNARLDHQVSPLIRLGDELDAHGFARCEALIRQLIRTASAEGVGGAAIGVLADTAAPDVARLRAFAAVSAALVNATGLRRRHHLHLVGAA